MSIADEILRLQQDRNNIRTKLIDLGIATSEDKLDELTSAIMNISNRGAQTASLDGSTKSYTIPSGYHNGGGSVSVSTQTKSTTATTSAQTISADSGKLLTSVTVNPQVHSGTYTYPANSTGGTTNLGAQHNYQYVNASNVYSKGYADGKAAPYLNTSNTTSYAGYGKGQNPGSLSYSLTSSYQYVFSVFLASRQEVTGGWNGTFSWSNTGGTLTNILAPQQFFDGTYYQRGMCRVINSSKLTITLPSHSSCNWEYFVSYAVLVR
jgi:hypothetical protein